ncbi:hypothetical protein HanXRQr2_Chr09g0403701 [Helianthus annuus]|uniref:Uncharacterized protein n=1 Tax=Helianthus annuus TaxID=4232 RepID=A0A9K3N9S3_HELAN|nr:hypothetical protein HanXRQr2_Chr09g0403701 [Helianthus annuus]KAJ0894489.1 hypothetical protein HanPSC8_Chr09g0389601 [Helianthus annuus]
MGTKLTRIPLQTICRWRFATRATHTRNLAQPTDLAAVLHEKLNAQLPTQISNGATIYRVPAHLRLVEPKAYEPNIVSIGPYHHGAAHLQAMEITKWNFFHDLFNPSKPDRPNLNAVHEELKQMEQQARSFYSEDLKMNSDQFIHMMLVDSCFIIQLLRETREIDFSKKSMQIQRWMLPVLQRDLIMLENQLPMFVLNKVYDLTTSSSSTCEATEKLGLKELALQYFEPMMYKDLDTPKNGALGVEGDGGSHFLELFRASICPTEVSQNKFLVKEPHMFRSVSDLKESGVKVKKAENCQPLDVRFKKGVLKIAPVSMDDYRFTLFRNMVAFEQCHFGCKPHVTAYVFFLDRLINSGEDIGLLHYSGVLQHTLGGNKHAARLVNKLCKEVAGAADDSYLRDVLWEINCYCNDGWHQKRAKLKHEYFYNVWVSVATIAAILVLYLTILQTVWELGDDGNRAHMLRTGFWRSMADAFAIPFGVSKPSENAPVPVENEAQILEWFFGYKACDDPNFFFMSC